MNHLTHKDNATTVAKKQQKPKNQKLTLWRIRSAARKLVKIQKQLDECLASVGINERIMNTELARIKINALSAQVDKNG